jgi:hypothetical protein
MRMRAVFLFCAVLWACWATPVQSSMIISELLADNSGGLKDFAGDSPDWIELHNRSATTVNLTGWFLTDSTNNLTRWRFPAMTVQPDARLVVFASGKNLTNTAELHTSFSLDRSGGFLALVAADGTTVVHSVSYPALRANVSYGTGASNTFATLVSSNAPVWWIVPTATDPDEYWTNSTADTFGWTLDTFPLRYDLVPGSGTPILSLDVNARSSNVVATTQAGFTAFTMGGSGIQTTPITRTYGNMAVTLSNSSPSIGYDDRLRTAPSNAGAFTYQNLLRDVLFSRDPNGTSGLDLHVTGLTPGEAYDFRIWSFDAGSLGTRVSDWSANGVVVSNNYSFTPAITPTSNNDNSIAFRVSANANGTVVVSARRDLTSVDGANAPSFGVFFNGMQIAPVNAPPNTNGNVASLFGQNASLFTRALFNVAAPAAYQSLRLRMRYNGGFVAYLNGAEVARRNAPANPAYNSSATASNSPASVEEIILPGAAALLVPGDNALAIHALNVSPTNATFFLQPELIAQATVEFTNRYLAPPTPGTDNNPGFLGQVADTKFSVNRGFYEEPFFLSITSATAGAEIRFTTNGSAPSPTNGFVFTAPIHITGHSVIRAAAFLPDHLPSGIDTHTYIFLRDVLRQSNNIPGYPQNWIQASYPADYEMDTNVVNHPFYGATISNDLRALAALSIVTDHDGLWGAARGIYTHPTSLHDLSTGQDWERAASVELILPEGANGETAFAVNGGLRIQGNASRDNVRTPKHSFRLLFNGELGDSKLRYDWFPGAVEEFDNLVLRAVGFVDAWPSRYSDNTLYTNNATGEVYRGARYRPETGTYLRDLFVKESHRDMGWMASRSSWVHLYINGLYWGIYNPSERIDSSFMANHFGGWEQDWDVLVGDDTVFNAAVADGRKDDWSALIALVNAGINSEAAYAAVTNLLDVDSLIDYMLLHIYIEAEDWPHHNWYAAHRRANPTNGLPATKWQFFTWDQEVSLDRNVRRDRTGVGASGNTVDSPARFYWQLRAWPEFRRAFGDRVQKHLFNDGALSPSNNVARFARLASAITNAIVAESARWGDAREFPNPGNTTGTGVTFTRDEWWVPELHKLWTNLFPSLHGINLARLRAAQLYPSNSAPVFNQFGGAVSNGFTLVISHSNPSGTIYFTTDGADPREYGSAAVAPSAQAYSSPVAINSPTHVRARVLMGSDWSALVEATFYPPQDLTRLVLSELMYNPPALGATNADDFEFIELKNTGTNTLDLSGLTFSGVTFTFTNGSTVAPGAFVVLARNAQVFASRYPGVPVFGVYGGRLDNGGETLTLSHALGTTILALTYDDIAPWPVAPDGFGFSLVPRQTTTQASDNGAGWRASAVAGGSPGADDPQPNIPVVVVNELLSYPDADSAEFVELFNPTTSSVDISGWFLTDDASAPKKYRFPNGTTIPANGYLMLFANSDFNVTPGASNSFGFSDAGEHVYLLSGDATTNLTGYSHGFVFGASEVATSFGRYVNSVGEEQFPRQRFPSAGSFNPPPHVGPVVISEIHYNPAPGGDEFIELKNISASAVSFAHPALTNVVWRLAGVDFSFPSNAVLQPQQLALVVATNPVAFIAKYAVPSSVLVLGPWGGTLQDSGERLELLRPDYFVTTNPFVYATESVRYNDRAPWPAGADGAGLSLQRREPHRYGDDPNNWLAAPPTPGRELDSDADGAPDFWEIAVGTNPNIADGNVDADGDGFTNAQEFVAGTNPFSAASVLRVESASREGTNVWLRFTVGSNRVVRVLYKDRLDEPTWSVLQDVPMRAADRRTVMADGLTNSTRFYRLAIP